MEIIRGDTARFKFVRRDSNGNVISYRPDKMFFTVKQVNTNRNFIFQKTIEDMTQDDEGAWHFVILSEDTNELHYGKYVYDIEVIIGEDKRTISRGTLDISYEVTWEANE